MKWLLIPAGLGAAGYYYIGPQFGKASGLKPPDVLRMAGQAVAPAVGGMPEPPSIEPPKRPRQEPEVEVTVSRSRPIRTRTQSSRTPRAEATVRREAGKSKGTKTSASKAEAPPTEEPAPEETPDEAGTGGMSEPDGNP